MDSLTKKYLLVNCQTNYLCQEKCHRNFTVYQHLVRNAVHLFQSSVIIKVTAQSTGEMIGKQACLGDVRPSVPTCFSRFSIADGFI
jgi:hypothetical protein